MDTLDVPTGDEGDAHRQAVLDATFTGFFSSNRDAAIRFLNRLEADRGMVEDVTQEAFLAVRARWDTVREYSDPTAWLMVVAKNKVYARRRLQELAEQDGFRVPAGRRRR